MQRANERTRNWKKRAGMAVFTAVLQSVFGIIAGFVNGNSPYLCEHAAKGEKAGACLLCVCGVQIFSGSSQEGCRWRRGYG